MKAAILAGGRGRRMGGVRKALLEVEGRRIVDRQLEVLLPLFEEVLLVVNTPEGWDVPRARIVVDAHPGQGPLAGLQASLAHGDCFVVGCDLPFLDEKLIQQICTTDAQAVVPRVEGRAQPLHARYSATALPLVTARLQQGKLRLVELLDELEVRYLDLPPQRGLTNVNTPDELTALRR